MKDPIKWSIWASISGLVRYSVLSRSNIQVSIPLESTFFAGMGRLFCMSRMWRGISGDARNR